MMSKLYDIAYIKTFIHRHFISNDQLHNCTHEFLLYFIKKCFIIKKSNETENIEKDSTLSSFSDIKLTIHKICYMSTTLANI